MSDQLQFDPSSDSLTTRGHSSHAPVQHTARDTQTDEIHLSDYMKVVYRRRWPALTAFLLVVVTVLVYTFTATPIFEARVQLLIESENPNVVSFKEVLEQEKTTNDYYQTQYRILQSRSLARRTLDRLQLWDTFDPSKQPVKFTIRGAIAKSRPDLNLFRTLKSIEPWAADETAVQSSIINGFLANLTVSPIRNSRLVEVAYASPYPEIAAQVANGLASAYIEQNLEFKFTASKDASDWLGLRLAEQRKAVEVSEGALQKYREQNDAVSLEERQNIVVQKLADLNAAVTRARPSASRRNPHTTRFGPSSTTASRSIRFRRFWRTSSSSSRRPSWLNCSVSRPSCRTSSVTVIPTWSRFSWRFRPPRRASRARSQRAYSRSRTITRRRWRRNRAWSARSNSRNRTRWRSTARGSTTARSSATPRATARSSNR